MLTLVCNISENPDLKKMNRITKVPNKHDVIDSYEVKIPVYIKIIYLYEYETNT